jgi:hypothetical protein
MTARKKNPKKPGPKPKMTPDVLRKIEEAAALDASVEEMCFYADVSRDTYDRYMKAHPEFAERVAKLRQKPILAARQAVVKHATDSYSNAMDYLSRKKKNEFSQRQELTGEEGKDLGIVMLPPKPAQ